MITAYILGIPTLYEGESIEIRYAIYNEDEMLLRKNELQKYVKPQEVAQTALITLLKVLEPYRGQDITVLFDDGALHEQIRGTYKSKNREVLKLAELTRAKIRKFGENITFQYVGANHETLKEFHKVLSN